MSDNIFDGSAEAGSPIASSVPNANDLGGNGQTHEKKDEGKIDPEQHKELESLAGRLGKEVGEYRQFFTDIAPLLDKLDKSPEIVQAIVDGNITPELAKAAMEGKISLKEAEVVTKAHDEVKKDLGKEYKGSTPEEINKLVEDKAKEMQADFDKKFKQRDELAAFESSINEFISKTTDFSKYAAEIDKWIDDHDVTDIAVAYYAVKGEISEREARKQAEIARAEMEKSGAQNMSGGNAHVTHVRDNKQVVDSLIASKANPNVF